MARYQSEWCDADEPERERGQVFGGPRGLCYAIESARRGIADGATLWDRIVNAVTGEVIYDSRAGIDKGDCCARCGGHGWCKDPSAHFIHERGQEDTQWYPQGA